MHVVIHWISLPPIFLDNKTWEISQMLDSCLHRDQVGSILLMSFYSDEHGGPEATSSLLRFYWEGLGGNCWIFFCFRKRGSGNEAPLLWPSEVIDGGCDYKVTWGLWGRQWWDWEELKRSINRVTQVPSCGNILSPASGLMGWIRSYTSCCPAHAKELKKGCDGENIQSM